MWSAVAIRKTVLLLSFAFIIGLSFMMIFNVNDSMSWRQETINSSNPEGVWISISVCFSSNTNLHGKQNYPYKVATRLSSSLWRQIAQKQVIVQVVYEDKDENSDDLLNYVKSLEEVEPKWKQSYVREIFNAVRSRSFKDSLLFNFLTLCPMIPLLWPMQTHLS